MDIEHYILYYEKTFLVFDIEMTEHILIIFKRDDGHLKSKGNQNTMTPAQLFYRICKRPEGLPTEDN